MGFEFCSLASGSSGNCQYVGSKDTKLLVDAGLTGKYIIEALNNIDIKAGTIDGLLITHEHTDHIKGVGVLMRKFDIPLYVNKKTWDAMKGKIGSIEGKDIRLFNDCDPFFVGDIKVNPYNISHDASNPVGYSFVYDDSKISIATDLGCVTNEIIDEIKDSDLLVIESNHDVEMVKFGRYPWFLKKRILGDNGHLSNETAGNIITEVVKKGKVKHVLLAHLSKENNFPELAYETVKNIVEENKIKVGLDINIDLTYRNRVGRLYKIQKNI
ncbi:MBL fold metallo-hydrolase [Paramaledivibacter caminithermalis]|jgi:phosphoribosyl 1,2-cyclic phosphodiesterase|uniref:Phosphoribosyl 1,2-cyclic phosphodiesterase n=1 Tax=Paramaledivibacter caminithermalis (strain DSM 15212 / CIP 107654 / DViRD3) TaxID=1121301 RepID=A0A1M6NC52_PARC5|nr:MBL fold metallo-hydrolase [Paramaledivibacter caminithermalis]SHJ93146.1 Phosphoribosyl 1,2-cyclic phosphodiesterase [Paramaledivibacter caminithermalis DSM 15212]